MPSYQRTENIASQKSHHFLPQIYQCHACHDTGLITNGDGLATQAIKDHDGGDWDGNRVEDHALVCWCKAAYGTVDPDNGDLIGGFRKGSGEIIKIECKDQQKEVPIGISCPREVVTRLHSERGKSWQKTVQAMNQARRERKRTIFHEVGREAINVDSDKFPTTNSGFSSIGQTLGGLF